MPKLVVFGLGWSTTGSTTTPGFGVGGHCVRIASEKGWEVLAVARTPSKYRGFYSEMKGVTVVEGDVSRPETLVALLRGADAAVFAAQAADGISAKEVDRDGCINLAKECEKQGVKLIVVSSVGVSRKHPIHPIRFLLNRIIKWGMMDAKWEAEEYVRRHTKVRHTIIRPGQLVNGAGTTNKLDISQADSLMFGGSALSKADVAKICVAAAADPLSDYVTFEVQSSKSTEPLSLDIFSALKKDRAD